MAEVAVIMAAYNGEKFIAEQIDSILDNSFTDIELHICDDGSTGGNGDIFFDMDGDWLIVRIICFRIRMMCGRRIRYFTH